VDLPPEATLRLDALQTAILHNWRCAIVLDLAQWQFNTADPAASLHDRHHLEGQYWLVQTILEQGAPGYAPDVSSETPTPQVE
jgi:hypothetical protein